MNVYAGDMTKMPNVDGPMRIPNQAVVLGSPWTIDRPSRMNLSTSACFPGFASSLANNATLTVCFLLHSIVSESVRSTAYSW